MSSTSCSSDECSSSDDGSEFNYIPGYYEPDNENQASDNFLSDDEDDEIDVMQPYSNEPMADEERIKEYKKRQAEKERRLESLKDRLAGKEELRNWCSCGKCSTTLLQNANECYCCQDMEKCIEALSDEWVLEEMQTPPSCITLHPAFQTVCLDRWSLRLSAGKYRTIDGKSYRQTGSEETFMRSVSYREFIHLVCDRVGKNIMPLPACAYHAIRSKFHPKDSNECFVGFEDEDEEMDD